MSVYVDVLRDWGWRLGPSCHLIADTNEELHEFALKIGMKREWFQKSSSGPHYDLVRSRRIKAVQLGAIELDDKKFHVILEKWREEAIKKIKSTDNEEERKKIREYIFR